MTTPALPNELTFSWDAIAVTVAVVAPLFYWAIRRPPKDTRPQDLTSFVRVKKAFNSGSLTDWKDSRVTSAAFVMKRFAADGASPAQREEIANLVRQKIEILITRSDNQSDNLVNCLLGSLSAAAPPWEADLLESITKSCLGGLARGHAIKRLVKIRGTACLDLLLELADDPVIAPEIAEAIGRVSRKGPRPEALTTLRTMLNDRRNTWTPSAAARALISLGLSDDPAIAEHLDDFDPWMAFAFRVKASGMDARPVIERFLSAQIIDAHTEKLIKPAVINKLQKALDKGDGYSAIHSFLQRTRAACLFETKSGGAPDYGQVLSDLSKTFSRRLLISEIDPLVYDENCREITCKVDGLQTRLNPKPMGKYIDLEAVLNGLNASLATAGKGERFVSLRDDGACVIFGDGRGILELVDSLGLPLDPSVDLKNDPMLHVPS